MLTRDQLHEYQRRAVRWIVDNPACALWVDMGLGKTVTTLTALSDLFDQKQIKRVLIVAPLRVALNTWPSEPGAWEHLQGITISQAAGLTPKQRVAVVNRQNPITVINRELIPWLVEHFGQAWPFDVVVIDESSGFKSHSSKRWKSLRKVLGKIDRMIQLTGTPAPNSLIDLWPQLYLLDQGARLGKTRGVFLQKFCEQVGNPSWNQWRVKESRAPAIHKAVSDLALRLDADEFLKLPERVDVIEQIKMPKKAMDLYTAMEREFIVKVEKGEITAANAAVQVGKLLQICNGAIYDEDGAWHEVHNAKLDRLKEIVDEAQEPILLAYSYRCDLQLIVDKIGGRILDKSEETVNLWNKGQIPLLLAHPASAGHGLNLQRGGSLAVWYGPTYSLELYQQFNARLHRQGQERPVRIIHLVTQAPAEAAVLNALREKRVGQDALLSFLKLKTDKGVE